MTKKFFIPLLFIGLLLFIQLGSYPLNVPDGARYAEIPREMLVFHNFITPHLNGLPYLEKPPLFYWLQVLSIKAFGVHEFAVSFPNAMIAFLCCLTILLAARKIFNDLTGILSAVILATSSLFFVLARTVTLDMTLTLFLTLSLMSFIVGTNEKERDKQRWYMWCMYVFAALATMTKGLVGAIFPAVIILSWVASFHEWSNIKKYCIPTGLAIFVIIVLPWHILVQLQNPDFFRFYFFEQHFLRYFTTYAGHAAPLGFLLSVFLLGFFPWIFFLPQAVKNIFSYYKNNNGLRYQYKVLLFLLIWAGFILLFYSFSDSKLIPYLLPMLPPCAIIVGAFCAHKLEKLYGGYNGFLLTVKIISLVFVLCGIALFIIPKVFVFSKLSFDIILLTKEAWLFLLGGTLLYITLKLKPAICIIVLIIVTASIYYLANPIITTINNKSIKPLAVILQHKLKPNDEVLCYDYYYQDLPFYLQRIVSVVNYKGELKYGIEHIKNSSQWMLDDGAFYNKWNSEKKVYMIIEQNKYDQLSHNANIRMYVIDRYLDRLLIVNTDS